MLNAGSLTETVILQEPIMVQDSTGDVIEEYRTIAKLKAGVRFLKGTRAVMFGDVYNTATISVTIRHSPRFANAKRVIWDGKVFTVMSNFPDRMNGSNTITAELFNEGQEVKIKEE